MANDLVVQLGAKLDQFNSDMNQAGDIADAAVSRIENSFSNLNPGLGSLSGLAAIFTGATGSIGALLASLVSVNSELAEISRNAELVGVSVGRYQSILYAAGQGGVSSKDAVSDLQNVARLLADASVNQNSLTKTLQANNIAYKDANGQVISLDKYLGVAADLINRFPNLATKIQGAQALGLSAKWVDAVKGGAQAFNDVAQAAGEAGAVIDSETVAKAANFDAAWQKSSDLLSRQFKAAISDVAGSLDDLIDQVNDFLKKQAEANGTTAGAAGQAKFDAYADAVDVARKQTLGLTQNVDQLDRVIARMEMSGGDPAIIQGLIDAREEAKKTADKIAEMQQLAAKSQFPDGNIPLPQARPAAANAPSPNAAKLAERGGDNAKDAYDRAQESIEKYTARTQALADTEGLGAAATEEMKAQAQLLTAAQQAGIPITDKVRDHIQDLAQDAGDAAGAMAKAKVVADTVFSSKTAFLTPQDLAIAQQLKGVYGNDIPAALNSTEAAGLRAADALKQISQLGQDVNKGFLVDFETQIRNGATAMQALQTAGVNALGKIADKLAQMAADQLWTNAFGGTSSAGLLGKLFGIGGASSGAGGSTTGLSLTGTGGLYDGGGYTGPGGKYQPAGIVHKGEVVFSQDDVARLGGVGVVEGLRRGYADGGVVGMPSIPSVAAPSSSSMTVQAGSTVVIQGDASEKTVGLIKAALAQHDATLPMKVVAAVKDAKARRVLA